MPLARSPTTYERLFGLFIGVEKFPHSGGEISSLMHANEDAASLCALFLAHRRRRKRKDDLCLLVNREFDPGLNESVRVKEATRANILKELTRCLKVAQANDLLLVYISTHGVIDFDDYFFIPSDGDLDNILGTGIASAMLIGAIGKASGRGVKALLVLDTCHSGAVSFDISKYKGEFACLLSSSPVEYSYEFFNIEHGVFTEYLIKGLEGEAQQDNQVTLIGLYDYIYRGVQARTQKRQNPLLIGTMSYDTILLK